MSETANQGLNILITEYALNSINMSVADCFVRNWLEGFDYQFDGYIAITIVDLF